VIAQRLIKLIRRGHIVRLFVLLFASLWLSGCGGLVSIVTATLVPTAVQSPTVTAAPVTETSISAQVTNPTKTPRVTRTPKVTKTPKATRTSKATRTPKVSATGTPLPTTLDGFQVVTPADLPPEAQDTLALIAQGGPFPYKQDGVVFQNREGYLPKKSSSYYHEYTVVTPGSSDRGARRIITGGKGEIYYTDDHYATFVRVIKP
jgi:guanyl-specific ribonuclease Sa